MKAIAAGLTLVILAGCGAGTANTQPPAFAPEDQSTCKVRKSQANPLIVEWPSAERASLEARSRQGLVVVRYDGCELQLLTRCSAPGAYRYTAVSRKKDSLRIKNEDELWASMPLGAASLEGKLRNGGEIGVDMTLVGTYQSDRVTVSPSDLEGICDGATHVIGGLSVGAFALFSESVGSTEGGASVAGVGAGASATRTQSVLASDGRPEACEGSSSKDVEPPDGCGALLRIEVIPLAGQAAPAPVADNTAKPEPAPPAEPLPPADTVVHRYLDAANAQDSATQSKLASQSCWNDECGGFAKQAGTKFRVELSDNVRSNGKRAVAGVRVMCPPQRGSARATSRWIGFAGRVLGGAPPPPVERECDFVYLYLEHGTQGWKVMWIDEDGKHAEQFLAGTQPAVL